MSDIITKRLKENMGKVVRIFLNNDFRYEGKVLNCDEKYLELLEPIRGLKILSISDIKNIDFLEEVDDGKGM